MPPEVREYFRKKGAEGGKLGRAARMKQTTKAQRKGWAQKAAKARWAKAKRRKHKKEKTK